MKRAEMPPQPTAEALGRSFAANWAGRFRGRRMSASILRTAIPDSPPGARVWRGPVAASVMLHAVVVGAVAADWRFGEVDRPTVPPAAMVVQLALEPAAPPAAVKDVAPGPEQQEAAPMPTQQQRFEPPPQVDATLKPAFALPLKKPEVTNPLDAQVATAATMASAPPAAAAPPSDKAVAPVEGAAAGPPTDAEQAWEGEIAARLARKRRYPATAQRAGQQGTVFLRMVFDRTGRLLGSTVNNPASQLLDAETLDLARRAKPYPAPPASVAGDTVVRIFAIEFYVNKRR